MSPDGALPTPSAPRAHTQSRPQAPSVQGGRQRRARQRELQGGNNQPACGRRHCHGSGWRTIEPSSVPPTAPHHHDQWLAPEGGTGWRDRGQVDEGGQAPKGASAPPPQQRVDTTACAANARCIVYAACDRGGPRKRGRGEWHMPAQRTGPCGGLSPQIHRMQRGHPQS